MAFGKKTILYFAPHQDDELLSMGIDICESLRKKYEVHVILCSDGSKSYVRKLLNNGKECKKHQGIHHYELSIEEFIKARDREFIGSCLALGVPESNIHIPDDRDIDGSVSVTHTEALINRFLSRFQGNAEVRTIAPNNGQSQHRDHKSVGQAADRLLKAGKIRTARFFIEPYLFDGIYHHPYLCTVEPTVKKAASATLEKIKAAMASYSLWAPEQQRYAVGYHSVTTEFNDFLERKSCYYFDAFHPGSMSKTEKLYTQHRRWKKLTYQSLNYYSLAGGTMPDLGELQLVSVQARDTAGYKEFCRLYNTKLTEKNLQRIRNGSSFWCLVSKESEVFSSGWVAYQQQFSIGEADLHFRMGESQAGILYDFMTIPSQRGKGLYPLLLQCIVSNAPWVKQFIIYTSPDNQSSSRGILKAGFQHDGTFTVADGSMKSYLWKLGFTEIHRSYLLFGAKIRTK